MIISFKFKIITFAFTSYANNGIKILGFVKNVKKAFSFKTMSIRIHASNIAIPTTISLVSMACFVLKLSPKGIVQITCISMSQIYALLIIVTLRENI